MRHWGEEKKKSPFHSHIESMTGASLAAESVARVNRWHAFKSVTKAWCADDRRGENAGGAISLAPHIHIARTYK